MAEKTFNQTFDGYYRDINKEHIPEISAVYFVYTCTYNPNADTVSIEKLIYIGESNNIKSRIFNHDRYKDWLKELKNGQTLCFSYTSVDNLYRNRLEAAYIYKHKPPLNIEYVNNFPFDRTTVISQPQDKTAFISKSFTVDRKD